MDVELRYQPDSAIAQITLEPEENLYAQAGCMVAMSANMEASTTLRQGKGGGFFGGIRNFFGGIKRMFAGESLFLSQFTCTGEEGQIFLAPKLIGDLITHELSGEELVVQANSYLASSENIDLDVGVQGLKSLFSGESIFWLSLSGEGTVLLTSFGGIYEIPVDGEYIVDTGHIVAFERSLDFQVTKAGSSWIGSLLGIGGEGLVCRFEGQGKVYCQTHNNMTFGYMVGSRLPPRRK
jgi:uncharacterized protein (TIGR00266 family)